MKIIMFVLLASLVSVQAIAQTTTSRNPGAELSKDDLDFIVLEINSSAGDEAIAIMAVLNKITAAHSGHHSVVQVKHDLQVVLEVREIIEIVQSSLVKRKAKIDALLAEHFKLKQQ